MGCDIHVYLEYKNRDQSGWNKDWNTLAFDGLFIQRDYTLFALMANVRNYDNITPVSEQKGIPSDINWATKNRYYLHIDSKHLDLAKKWVNSGQSTILDAEGGREVREGDFISSPDWHNASYMDIKEVRAVNKRLPHGNASFKAVIGAMGALERAGYESRIVFFFDN